MRVPLTLLFVLLITAIYINASAKGLRGKWWKEPRVRQELALSDEQVERIEHIFHTYVKKMRRVDSELRRQHNELRLMAGNPDSTSDEIRKASLSLESTKNSLIQLKLNMFLEIREVLSPEQRMRLHQLKMKGRRHK